MFRRRKVCVRNVFRALLDTLIYLKVSTKRKPWWLSTEAGLLPCMALQNSDAPISLPQFQIVAVEHLGGFRLGFIVVSAVELLDSTDMSVLAVSAVVHRARSPLGTPCHAGAARELT